MKIQAIRLSCVSGLKLPGCGPHDSPEDMILEFERWNWMSQSVGLLRVKYFRSCIALLFYDPLIFILLSFTRCCKGVEAGACLFGWAYWNEVNIIRIRQNQSGHWIPTRSPQFSWYYFQSTLVLVPNRLVFDIVSSRVCLIRDLEFRS